MTKKNIVVAFDLDGTLLDSAGDLIETLNILLKENNLSLMKKSDVNNLVGNGALAMIKKAFQKNNISNINDIKLNNLKSKFLKIYSKNYAKKSKLYPYAKEILKELKLKNYKIILVSNKPEYYVKKIIKYFDISKYFSAISGGDTFAYRKPDPKHLYETIKLTKSNKVNCVFIGDSINDAICAKESNSKLILMTYGYSDIDVHTMGADLTLNSLKNLPKLVDAIEF